MERQKYILGLTEIYEVIVPNRYFQVCGLQQDI